MAWGAAFEHVEIRIHYRVNDQVCMNVLHYKCEGNGAGGEPQELTGGVLDDFTAGAGIPLLQAMQAMQGQNCKIYRVTAQGIWPIRYKSQFRLVDLDGAIAQDCEVQNVQASIQKAGQLGDRHNIGAFHLGGLPIQQFNNGDLTDPALAQLETLAVELLTTMGDGISPDLYVPVILNKEPIPDTDPVRYQIIGSSDIYDVEAKRSARVMYRRTKGIGI